MCVDILHEVVGHGGTCLLLGQNITLLTSVYFRSTPGSFITDLGGPLSNLFFGFMMFFILKQKNDLSILFTFFLMTVMFYNFFWFSGTVLQSSFSKNGDWTYALSKLNIGIYTKPVLVIAGIAAYYFAIKIIRTVLIKFTNQFPDFPLRQGVHYSYFAAALAAIIAGLFFAPERVAAAGEGLLEMIGSLPILFILPPNAQKNLSYIFRTNFTLLVIVFISFIVFCLILGKGIMFY